MERRSLALVCLALSTFAMTQGLRAESQCIGLVKGAIVFDVTTCKSVVPKDDFNPKADLSFYNGMTAADKTNFMAQYQGLMVSGFVVKSSAIQKGLDTKQGALAGKTLRIFLPQAAVQCQHLQSKRITGNMDEACCSGAADAPCLLDTPYVLKTPTIIGDAGTAAGDKERTAAVNSPTFQKGVKAFKEKKYKDAANFFEEMRRGGQLDVKGHFLLGLTYRNLDECKKAIPVLSVVFDRANKKDVWADQDAVVRRSNFLLARCYAKTNQPGRATLILNAYLIEAKHFKTEIEQSLKNSDFGWINASKEYQEYAKEAKKKLNALNK